MLPRAPRHLAVTTAAALLLALAPASVAATAWAGTVSGLDGAGPEVADRGAALVSPCRSLLAPTAPVCDAHGRAITRPAPAQRVETATSAKRSRPAVKPRVAAVATTATARSAAPTTA